MFSSLSSSSLDHLQGEAFGGLVQHALGLLGALQQIVDLRSGGDFDLQLLAQQERQFVGEVQLTGIGHGDHQSVFARFHRHEVVTEHQFGGNTAEKIRVNPLFAQVHEGAAIAFRQFLGLIAFHVLATSGTAGTIGLLVDVAIES